MPSIAPRPKQSPALAHTMSELKQPIRIRDCYASSECGRCTAAFHRLGKGAMVATACQPACAFLSPRYHHLDVEPVERNAGIAA